MAQNFDGAPIYDPITQDGSLLSDVMQIWLDGFVQNVASYLSEFGIFIPRITTVQRDSINNPGTMMIYNTTIEAPQIFQNGTWKTFTTT
jgi:hypothetical protein